MPLRSRVPTRPSLTMLITTRQARLGMAAILYHRATSVAFGDIYIPGWPRGWLT